MLLERSTKTSLALILALSPWACGEDDPAQTPLPEAPGDIVAVASANSDFSTLVTAIQRADLVTTLQGPGPLTVFAPTNAAFANLPAGVLDGLLADKAALQAVLTYHVVPGKVTAAQVVTLSEATSVEGRKISIEVRSGSVFLNGNVKVTVTDIAAKNGVIHVIDAVLTPPDPPKNIAQIAAGNPDFSTLVAALTAADLVDTLAGAGPYTVFAPTNAAFAALPAGTVDALLANIPELTKVLTYHVVSGKVEAAQVVTLTEATTVQGAKVKIEVRNGKVFLNDAIEVIMTDIQASNGVIHVIGGVLLPPSIVDLALGTPDLSTLVTALSAADLVDTLSGPGPFTVFAPVNSAFAGLPAGTLEGLLADVPALTNVLTYHVVPGRFLAADVATASSYATAQGTNVAITTSGGDVLVDGARVIATDIIAGNGVVHLVDGVLLP